MRKSASNGRRNSNRNNLIFRSLAVAVAAAVAQGWPDNRALAISGTWSNPTTGGFWGTAGNWFSGNIADGSGFTADFGQLNLLADNIVKLNVNRTIGNLIFGDTTASHNWILDGNGFALNLAVASGTPTVTVNNQSATLFAVVTGSQGLTKAGPGTLLLAGSNLYTGGTTVNAGTLAVAASGAVLPANSNLTVNNGATFNYGNGGSITNSTAPIGTLSLNNGNFRVSGGTGDFYLNKLAIGATGGTVDFSGTNFFYTHFTGSGAAITVDDNSNWTGAGGSRILNDTNALLPIVIATDKTITSSVNFANGAGGFGYRISAGSTNSVFYLKNPTGSNTADFRVTFGRLRVDDMAALGSGTITLAGVTVNAGDADSSALLQYSGSTATSSKAISLDGVGGNIFLATPNAVLTLAGLISEAGGTNRNLTVIGASGLPSGLVLTAGNTYTGVTTVAANATLSIPTIANGGVAGPMGASSNAPANLRLGGGAYGGDGTLRYTGPTASTDRGATMNSATAKSTIDVFTAATTLTMSGQLVGPGGLTKAGQGTLLLTNATNTYANGTTVDAGTLAIGASGGVLPAGKNLTVNSGATFNYGNGATINNTGSAIGTMTLNNGTYRLSGGFGDFHLNQLNVGSTGGTLDFTGSTNYWTHFTGTGAGITVNADTTWTGAGDSRIQNDTAALLPITINNAKTVTSSVNFANGTQLFGYRLAASGTNATLYLKNPTSGNSADFRISQGTLRVDDMAALGSGTITLAGGLLPEGVDTSALLRYSGLTATSSKPILLDDAGGNIYLTTPNSTLTLSGVIGETGGTNRNLTVIGANGLPSSLALTAANTYTGVTTVSLNATLGIPTIANGGMPSPLGASTHAPANLRLGGGAFGGDGTLRYTGPTASTDRGATMNSATAKSTIDVFTAATTLTMSGQLVGPGGLTKAGQGTLLLTNATNTYANGTTVDAGTLAIGASGGVLPAGKNLTVNSGATFNYGNGVGISNSGASIGTLALNNGTFRVNGGGGDFYLNQLTIGATGGTVDFSGAGFFFTHFTGAGAALNVNANTIWTGGGGGARFQNDSNTAVPITVNSGKTLTSNVIFANGSNASGFRLVGGGVLSFNGAVNNSADFRVENGLLAISNIGSLGSGAITLAGTSIGGSTETTAALLYSGLTDNSSKPISLDGNGGVFILTNGGTNLTLSGTISEAGGTGRALTMFGGGGDAILTLNANNSYTGPTVINGGGTLSISTIANGGVASPLGASSNAPASLQLGGGAYGGGGTLRYTGPTASSDRGATLTSASYRATIDVSTAGTALTMSGQLVGPGGLTKAGPGTLRLTGANTYTGTTTLQAGTLSANTFAYTTVLNTSNGGLDILSGQFVFDYTGNVNPVSTIKSILTAGYDLASDFSTGQIRATTLASNRTLGYGDNGSAVTVMLTLPGDADLNGVVNFNDFLVLQNNFNNPNTTFAQGNFNYDGVTNFNDFLMLQNFFGQNLTGSSFIATSAQVAAMTAFANSVPEPAGLALLGVAAGLAGRRRRQWN